MKKQRICLFFILLLCLTLPLSAEADRIRLKSLGFQIAEERSPAPPLRVKDARGADRILPEKGSVILINFWASWSPPCRAEMPSLLRLYNSLNNEGFRLAAVNLNEEIHYVKDFLDKEVPALPVYYFPGESVLEAYKFRGIPASYIIDKQGRVAAVLSGSTEWDNPLIVRTIRELLNE